MLRRVRRKRGVIEVVSVEVAREGFHDCTELRIGHVGFHTIDKVGHQHDIGLVAGGQMFPGRIAATTALVVKRDSCVVTAERTDLGIPLAPHRCETCLATDRPSTT